MIKKEVIEDLRELREKLISEERLENLNHKECSRYDLESHYQELVIDWIQSDGVYEYTTHLTEEEIEKDADNLELTNEYVEYLWSNEL
jgi:hypothetical protein